MVADGASSRSTELTVPRHVAGHAADDGTLDASLRFGGGDRSDRQQAGRGRGPAVAFSRHFRKIRLEPTTGQLNWFFVPADNLLLGRAVNVIAPKNVALMLAASVYFKRGLICIRRKRAPCGR